MRFKNGLGGARSIEKARLYLALEPGKCTIRKAKIFRRKDRNPNGLSIAFKIVGGARFIPDPAGWRREGRESGWEREGERGEAGTEHPYIWAHFQHMGGSLSATFRVNSRTNCGPARPCG